MAAASSALRGVFALRIPRPIGALLLVAALAIAHLILRGQWLMPHDDRAPVFAALNDIRAWIDSNRTSNPVLVFLIDGVRFAVGDLVIAFRSVLGEASWIAVTTIAAMIGLVWCGVRISLLVGAGFLSFGILGLWQESMDTLALTLAAVALSLALGFPLGILAGRDERFMSLLRPVLDVMQIMPTIAYLAPLTLFFLIGPATAAIATLIYAVPATIRITALAIHGVAPATVEAAESLGATRWQSLRKVYLPMARRTLILALNQTLMMALAMVVITALINAPGLGQSIVRALQRVDVGKAFEAGLAIVIMAVLLDRLTSAASQRAESEYRAGRVADPRQRRRLLAGALLVSGAAIVAGAALPVGAEFPSALRLALAGPVNEISDWLKVSLYAFSHGLKDLVTYGLINPLQSLLVSSPWWLVVAGVAGIALLVGNTRAAMLAALCLLLIAALGLWEHGMITLASTLVATALTLALGLWLGIAFARNQRAATIMRPLLDAAQTMPSFVYLVPAIALFGATRFTAIVAALIYAAPPVIRLVEDGIRGVPGSVTEAAVSAGATPRQLLWKVQLPMARASLLLAANQGIVLVLAMVVVGGLVGAGALGFDVVTGFSRRSDFGRGLAAGVAIVLLGIMLDRITQAAGARRDRPIGPHG